MVSGGLEAATPLRLGRPLERRAIMLVVVLCAEMGVDQVDH
jgi:hypothetical protein